MDSLSVSKKLLTINVGAGSRTAKAPGQINADLYPGPNIDMVFDLTRPWPLKDNSMGHVRANHVLEHLADPMTFFKEAWRVLVPNGYLLVTVPYGPSSGGFCDVTHLRYWIPGTFCFLQPGYGDSVFNPQHDGWKEFFSIETMLQRVDVRMRRLIKWPFRWIGLRILGSLWDAYNEISTGLRALKSKEEVEHFKKNRPGNAVPILRVMHRHEYENRPLEPGKQVELVHLDTYEFGFSAPGEKQGIGGNNGKG